MPETVFAQHDAEMKIAASYLRSTLELRPSLELVRKVLESAHDDLRSEVPPEALPEFLHRLAHQRLVELLADSPAADGGPVAPTVVAHPLVDESAPKS